MSATKYKPVVPLPWTATGFFVDARDSKDRILYKYKGNLHSIAQCYGPHALRLADDIVHFANAYPKLIAALKELRASPDSSIGALLRELGEEE